jgi:hypothetical protein
MVVGACGCFLPAHHPFSSFGSISRDEDRTLTGLHLAWEEATIRHASKASRLDASFGQQCGGCKCRVPVSSLRYQCDETAPADRV